MLLKPNEVTAPVRAAKARDSVAPPDLVVRSKKVGVRPRVRVLQELCDVARGHAPLVVPVAHVKEWSRIRWRSQPENDLQQERACTSDLKGKLPSGRLTSRAPGGGY